MRSEAQGRLSRGSAIVVLLFSLALFAFLLVDYASGFALINGALLAVLLVALVGSFRGRNWPLVLSTLVALVVFVVFALLLVPGQLLVVTLAAMGLLVVLPRWLQSRIQRRQIVDATIVLGAGLLAIPVCGLGVLAVPTALGGACCAFPDLPAQAYRGTLQPDPSATDSFVLWEEVEFGEAEALYDASRSIRAAQVGLLGRRVEFIPLNPNSNGVVGIELPNGESRGGWFEPEQTSLTLQELPPSTIVSSGNYEATPAEPNGYSGTVEVVRDPITFTYLPAEAQFLQPLLAPFQGAATEGRWLSGLLGSILGTLGLRGRIRPQAAGSGRRS